MKVIKADVLGFCMGVKRVVDKALEVPTDNCSVYTYGHLIHNRSIEELLNDKGIRLLDKNSLPNCGSVIIRAHGIRPDEREKLEKAGLNVIDATCPKVLGSQKIVARAGERGENVILVGDKDHGEIVAISGCAKNVILVENRSDAENLPNMESAIVLAQTTIKEEEFNSVCSVLKDKVKNLDIKNTICSATRDRQQALVNLIEDVEAVLVIGGAGKSGMLCLYEAKKLAGPKGKVICLSHTEEGKDRILKCGLADEFAGSAQFNDFQIGFSKYWKSSAPSADIKKADLKVFLDAKAIEPFWGEGFGSKYQLALADSDKVKYYLVKFPSDKPLKCFMGTYYGYVVICFFDGKDILGKQGTYSSVSVNLKDLKKVKELKYQPDLKYYFDASSKGIILDGFGTYKKNKKDDNIGFSQSVNLEGYFFKLSQPGGSK